MHIPDGFFNAVTSVGAGAAAAATLGVAARKAGAELGERQAPLAGLVAAFVFAVQMVNFPVAAGTSGHLLGGALAAVLLGPWAGAMAVAVVLVVQLLFADGGLTALGLNIAFVAIIPAFAGYAVFRLARRVLAPSKAAVALATGLGAGLSVPISAGLFALLFAVGGNADVPVATLTAAMVGVHILIGIGEGLISAATVSAVLVVRPDLVHGAGDLAPEIELRGSAPARS